MLVEVVVKIAGTVYVLSEHQVEVGASQMGSAIRNAVFATELGDVRGVVGQKRCVCHVAIAMVKEISLVLTLRHKPINGTGT